MTHHETLAIQTPGRALIDVTDKVEAIVQHAGVRTGLCTVFCQHTSASLIISENADPTVQRDLEAFLSRLVPDGDPLYRHTAEGPDDMPAHVRSVLCQTSLGIPVVAGALDLGTWQAIYLWEHRHHPHRRRLGVMVIGDR
jgi:secondary thiamine-phosphate synthase enzyme